MLITTLQRSTWWLAVILLSSAQTAMANVIDGQASTTDNQVFYAATQIKDVPLDRTAAFTLTYAMLANTQIDESDKEILLELLSQNSSGLRLSGPTGAQIDITPPNAEARQVLTTLVSPKNMNDYWLKGEPEMKELIILAYLGSPAWQRATQFIASKFYAEWKNSSIENGYKPIRDIIATAYESGPDVKEDKLLGNAKATLLYDAMEMVDNHEQDKVPDFVYSWLPHDTEYRPFDRAPMVTAAPSKAEQIKELHRAITMAATNPSESGNWGFLPPMHGISAYSGNECTGGFIASIAMFGVKPTYYRLYIDYKGVGGVVISENPAGKKLLKIQGQCAMLAYEQEVKDVKQTAFSACEDIEIDRHTKQANSAIIAKSMAQIGEACTN